MNAVRTARVISAMQAFSYAAGRVLPLAACRDALQCFPRAAISPFATASRQSSDIR